MPLNIISFVGIFALCAIAWFFSEKRDLRYFPWRVVIWGIVLQLILGFLVFWFPPTKFILNGFSQLLNSVFAATDVGANFVFGHVLVPTPLNPPRNPIDPVLGPLAGIFAFRVLPAVIFFGGLMALLYNIGVIQPVVNFFAKIFYSFMRLSGAESLSGAANIFVGIEAAIVVKPFLPKMTRSELCAILACCFGTAASSTLAIYVGALRDVFPNILVHLVSASIIAIPACFVLSKILVPETEIPLTAGGIPAEEEAVVERDEQGVSKETVGGEVIERVSPVDAAILGTIDGMKMAVTIAAVLIFIVGFVSLINQLFLALAGLQNSGVMVLQAVGRFFSIVTLENILGALFLPLTVLTGVSLDWNELWQSSVLIGSRLLKTAIPSYIQLGQLAGQGAMSDRAILINSYALSGFAHLASVGIFVGGTIALIPSRRKDISELGWKALFIGTLATIMIACVAGVFDTGDPSILGEPPAQTTPANPPSAAPASPGAAPASPGAAPVGPGAPPVSPTPAATTTP
ncbi:nucleoside:proton symporter [Oscillatoria sp. FACHB-1407]|uniref:NupC/NupG family nucleoside CNT transporter n=1 Tax=Oscillatoria sp. FACHB-1407 TaxID=2692847 RepID=UPI0016856A03|nr:nucleoside transporter C-terminal domain-containing protein [Oscillatoria sp. FACHB-1407]MBD2459584.1 nucleoside:proton symporter [Oscillatoria sp. FACHB-1407]